MLDGHFSDIFTGRHHILYFEIEGTNNDVEYFWLAIKRFDYKKTANPKLEHIHTVYSEGAASSSEITYRENCSNHT